MDLTLPGRTTWIDLDVLFKACYSQWPSVIIESAATLPPQRLLLACQERTFAAHVAPLQEFVLYDCDVAFRFWREFGLTREFQSSVILIDFRPNGITLRVDSDRSGSYHVASIALTVVGRHRSSQDNSVNFWQRGKNIT